MKYPLIIGFFSLLMGCGSEESEFSPPIASEINPRLTSWNSGFVDLNGVSLDTSNIANIEYFKGLSTSTNDSYKGTWINIYQRRDFKKGQQDPVSEESSLYIYQNESTDLSYSHSWELQEATWNESKGVYEFWLSTENSDSTLFYETYGVAFKLSDSLESLGEISHIKATPAGSSKTSYALSSITISPYRFSVLSQPVPNLDSYPDYMYLFLDYDSETQQVYQKVNDDLWNEGIGISYSKYLDSLTIEGNVSELTIESSTILQDDSYTVLINYSLDNLK